MHHPKMMLKKTRKCAHVMRKKTVRFALIHFRRPRALGVVPIAGLRSIRPAFSSGKSNSVELRHVRFVAGHGQKGWHPTPQAARGISTLVGFRVSRQIVTRARTIHVGMMTSQMAQSDVGGAEWDFLLLFQTRDRPVFATTVSQTKAVASTLGSVEAFITPKAVPELNDVYHRDISQVVERDVCHLFFLAMRGYSRLASPSFITSIFNENAQLVESTMATRNVEWNRT